MVSLLANFTNHKLLLEKPAGLLGENLPKDSPADRLKDYSIKIYDDKITVFVKNPYLAKFTDTHSMEPVLGSKSTGIEIIPGSESDIKEGDIVSYAGSADEVIIHRVIKIGNDAEGWYAITKGDNNTGNDPGKIRFNQIKRILVGILY